MQKICKRSGRRRLYGSVPRWINGPAVIVLSSHKATARYRVGNGHGTRHRDINHTPYYRATRSRRADSQPSFPLRDALFLPSSRMFLFPFPCRVSARVSPSRAAVSTCFYTCLVSSPPSPHRCHSAYNGTRTRTANFLRALFLRRRNERSRSCMRSRDQTESPQRCEYFELQ